ncbi:MAG: DUF4294 domain-containing protein [Bacteroidetes bacterium]|nr:MAG: DUF4294 domain-containing protein [Bacteroidota bacterium]
MRKAVIIISLFFAYVGLSAQQVEPIINYGIIIDGDTISNIFLEPVYIVDYKKFPNERAKIRYTRLVRYVKKVYPYAKLAGKKLQEYDNILQAAKTDREKKKVMKQVEKEFRAEYEGSLRKLTIGQGKILVKLLYRETDNSAYNLLKDMRGGFSATMWQGVGRLFGYNLKNEYDPKGEDRQIEMIVRMIERGII